MSKEKVDAHEFTSHDIVNLASKGFESLTLQERGCFVKLAKTNEGFFYLLDLLSNKYKDADDSLIKKIECFLKSFQENYIFLDKVASSRFLFVVMQNIDKHSYAIKVLKLFLQYGVVDINAHTIDVDGFIAPLPIQIAIDHNSVEAVELLLNYGANLFVIGNITEILLGKYEPDVSLFCKKYFEDLPLLHKVFFSSVREGVVERLEVILKSGECSHDYPRFFYYLLLNIDNDKYPEALDVLGIILEGKYFDINEPTILPNGENGPLPVALAIMAGDLELVEVLRFSLADITKIGSRVEVLRLTENKDIHALINKDFDNKEAIESEDDYEEDDSDGDVVVDTSTDNSSDDDDDEAGSANGYSNIGSNSGDSEGNGYGNHEEGADNSDGQEDFGSHDNRKDSLALTSISVVVSSNKTLQGDALGDYSDIGMKIPGVAFSVTYYSHKVNVIGEELLDLVAF